MKELLLNFKKTFYFMKGHYFKYSMGIVGMTFMRCTAALIQAYLLNVFLHSGAPGNLLTITKIFAWLLVYIVIITVSLPVFQFWFNGQAKYGHGSINKAIYHKYGRLPAQYFEKNHSGKIMSLFLNDTWLVSGIFMRHFRRVVAALISIIIYLIPMLVLDYRITIILLILNLLTMAVNVKVSAWMKSITKTIQEKSEEMISAMSNMINGMSVIRIYGLYEKMAGIFKSSNQKAAGWSRKRAGILSGLAAYHYTIYIVSLVTYLFAGSLLVKLGLSTFGNILAIMSLQASLDSNFRELSTYYPQFINGLASTERVYSFLEEEEERKYGKSQPLELPAYIELRNVSFSYDQNSPHILRDFNMKISKGEHVALVGKSGCGKSTVIKLLLGLFEAEEGSIAIEGTDISQLTLDELRQKIAYVPQSGGIYHETIEENIRYGNYKASKADIIQAAKLANAYDFIMALENGFNTLAGEQGAMLSGGQCQRIAIARAILKDAPILILDEATSALDYESEKRILDSIRQWGKDKTIITIAHRETTIQYADRSICIG